MDTDTEQAKQQSIDTPSEPTSQSAVAEQKPEPKGSWLDRILGRVPKETTAASDKEQAAVSGAAGEQKQGEAEQAKPQGRFVSDEELARLIQAEVDRREAKRLAEQRRAEKERLRKTDPYRYAEVEEQEAAAERFGQLLGSLAAEFDRAVIDPLILALPESERQSVLEKAGPGLDGRKAIAQTALESLKKHWLAEGEKQATEKLRKDPAFRKQLLVELRGEREEPEIHTGSPGAGGSVDMDTILRQAYQRRTKR